MTVANTSGRLELAVLSLTALHSIAMRDTNRCPTAPEGTWYQLCDLPANWRHLSCHFLSPSTPPSR
eukprot:12391053-Ditylum_brightwellii.AAC.1